MYILFWMIQAIKEESNAEQNPVVFDIAFDIVIPITTPLEWYRVT